MWFVAVKVKCIEEQEAGELLSSLGIKMSLSRITLVSSILS